MISTFIALFLVIIVLRAAETDHSQWTANRTAAQRQKPHDVYFWYLISLFSQDSSPVELDIYALMVDRSKQTSDCRCWLVSSTFYKTEAGGGESQFCHEQDEQEEDPKVQNQRSGIGSKIKSSRN